MSEDSDPTNVPPASVDRFTALWRRVADHKLVQWTVAYIALAYGFQHGVTLTSEAFEWPHAVERITMLLFVLGLPIAMTLAWYHGARASKRVSGAELSIISILLVFGASLFYVFAQPAHETTAVVPGAAGEANAVSLTPAAIGNGIALAVLPFANVSGDPGQEFFSDGMTDEIMTALAKVPGLTVLARTSAFEYKGRNRNIREIGQALGATYFVEGSVRKAGDQVRITAQLVRADSGASLWTESYDRELKNIFATQSDIAQAIAGALRIPLGLKPGDSLVANRTGDLDSYQEYLQGMALYRDAFMDAAIKTFENVVARDPSFAPAWAALARAYISSPNYAGTAMRAGPVQEARRLVEFAQEKAEAAARRAIQLDPASAGGYGALAALQLDLGKWADAEDSIRRGFALDPNDPDILQTYISALEYVGRLQQAADLSEKLHVLEPAGERFTRQYVSAMTYAGRKLADPIALLSALPENEFTSYYRNSTLAQAYADVGQYAKAADTLLAIRGRQVSRESVEDAARLMRQAPAKTNAPDKLPDLEGALNFVYAFVGAPEKILDQPERRFEIRGSGFDLSIWRPTYASVRKTERFKAFARKAGIVDYWKARGWPDLCHPVGADDFACN